MNLLRAAVAAASVLLVAGCGTETQTPSAESGANSFVPSFWTMADYRMQRVASATFDGRWQTVQNSIAANGVFAGPTRFVQRDVYDSLNRVARSEVRVFPKAASSELSAEGSVALRVEHLYPGEVSPASSHTVIHLWDNWWDGATGRLHQHISWFDEDVQQGTPGNRREEVVTYNTANDAQAIISTRSTSSQLVYNDQQLLVERKIDADGATENGFEQTETWQRYRDGRLRSVVNASSVTIASYDYNRRGALADIIYYSGKGARTSRHIYRYTLVDGHYAVIIEKHARRGSVKEYETEVRLYEERPCHATTQNRLRFSRPEDGACVDATAWARVAR